MIARLIVPAAAASLLVGAAAAASGSQAAGAGARHVEAKTSGAVSATLSWRGSFAETRNFRIAIDRAGVRVLDTPVRTKACPGGGTAGYACPWPTPDDALALRDLDGDGEPEAIVQAFTGGAHCCVVAIVYRWSASEYGVSEHNFLDAGYRLRDLDGDGLAEFRSADARFAYLYGAFAESVFPIRVMRFAAGEFTDDTAEFRRQVRTDARRARREYRQRADSRRRIGVRPALAAYVADLYRLDRDREARKALRSALRRGLLERQARFDIGPFGRRYIRSVKRHLRRWGYI